MSHEQERAKGAPVVVITEGPFKGFEGPVVGIDQQKGTVQVRVSMLGRKQTTVVIDVQKVRRIMR